MVRKVQVKPASVASLALPAVGKSGPGDWVTFHGVSPPEPDRPPDYAVGVHEAEDALQEEIVVEAGNSHQFKFDVDHVLEFNDEDDCGEALTLDEILNESEVEVGAYATLSESCSSRNKPSVAAAILEENLCPFECGEVMKSENHLRGHLKEKHAVVMPKEVHKFQSMGSFLAWKEAREREACRRYVVRETRHNWRRFACSRSGHPSGTERPRRWKKTGSFCPAYIRTKTAADGSVKARFCLLHTCQQPDNTPQGSQRELAKAQQQLSLLEHALGNHAPRERAPSDWKPTSERREDEPWTNARHLTSTLGGDPDDPVAAGSSLPPRRRRPRTSRARKARSAARAWRLRPAPDSCDTAASTDVKARAKLNLLRLHALLKRATRAEAEALLEDTAALLERHARVQRRGTTGRQSRLPQDRPQSEAGDTLSSTHTDHAYVHDERRPSESVPETQVVILAHAPTADAAAWAAAVAEMAPEPVRSHQHLYPVSEEAELEAVIDEVG